MATTPNSVITAQAVNAFTKDLSAQTATTTRAPTATASLATANIVSLVTTSTNGRQIKRITVKACGNSLTTANAANTVMIWQHDGTSAFIRDELLVTAVTPSASSNSFQTSKEYSDWNLPSTHSLYVSLGTTTTATGTALLAIVDASDL